MLLRKQIIPALIIGAVVWSISSSYYWLDLAFTTQTARPNAWVIQREITPQWVKWWTIQKSLCDLKNPPKCLDGTQDEKAVSLIDWTTVWKCGLETCKTTKSQLLTPKCSKTEEFKCLVGVVQKLSATERSCTSSNISVMCKTNNDVATDEWDSALNDDWDLIDDSNLAVSCTSDADCVNVPKDNNVCTSYPATCNHGDGQCTQWPTCPGQSCTVMTNQDGSQRPLCS